MQNILKNIAFLSAFCAYSAPVTALPGDDIDLLLSVVVPVVAANIQQQTFALAPAKYRSELLLLWEQDPNYGVITNECHTMPNGAIVSDIVNIYAQKIDQPHQFIDQYGDDYLTMLALNCIHLDKNTEARHLRVDLWLNPSSASEAIDALGGIASAVVLIEENPDLAELGIIELQREDGESVPFYFATPSESSESQKHHYLLDTSSSFDVSPPDTSDTLITHQLSEEDRLILSGINLDLKLEPAFPWQLEGYPFGFIDNIPGVEGPLSGPPLHRPDWLWF